MKEKKKKNPKNKKQISRRDLIKGLATLPIAGAVVYGAYKKRHFEKILNRTIADELGISSSQPQATPVKSGGKEIRIGLIGFGIRGKQLAKALGFVHPTEVDEWLEGVQANKKDTRYKDFLAQEDLNIKITAVCDIFDTYGQMARETAANIKRKGTGEKLSELPKRYLNYRQLIASPEVDAVVIATPDHWHGPMTIEAARAGKHIYCEKPMSWSVEETYEMRKEVETNHVVFQLGHQGRQTDAYGKAREALDKKILGPVNLVEVTTNRNDPNGAWVYPIHENANRNTIDWEQFIGQAPWHDFNLERFFRWRCWWDYSTGLSGDLLTHEYDAINQIMQVGIPQSAMSTGGIYFYKDGRTVPDVLTTVFEFPEKDLSMVYSATLSSQMSRGKRIMGHDAYMELGNTIAIYPDPGSTRYAEKITNNILKPDLPMYSYFPGKENVDAITSATELYFADRGLLYTYRGGKRMDTTHLHLKEWLDCIRSGEKPSCDIHQGFEEAITAHMGTLSYLHKKQVQWDADKEKILI